MYSMCTTSRSVDGPYLIERLEEPRIDISLSAPCEFWRKANGSDNHEFGIPDRKMVSIRRNDSRTINGYVQFGFQRFSQEEK